MSNNKLKILKNISYATCQNKQLRKALESYFWLKHHYSSGVVSDYTKNINEISNNCKISNRTFWTRLDILRKENIVTTTNSSINLSSWDEICMKYNISKNFYYINENIYDNVKIEYVLESKVIFEAKKKRSFAIKCKVSSNPFLLNQLLSITRTSSYCRKSILESAEDCFSNPSNYTEDEQYFLLKTFNYDNNLTCSSISNYINARSSASSGTYTKKKLVKFNLISVEHRRIESKERNRSSIYGHVFYSRPSKSTVLVMPDNIVF